MLSHLQLGDLSVVLDDKVKELVCEMSGKEEYEFGDLSVEIDKRVKDSVASYCGKENYEFGDLSKEFAKRTKEGVANFTGKSNYKFGDITRQAAKNLTGKDDYQVCFIFANELLCCNSRSRNILLHNYVFVLTSSFALNSLAM